MNYKLNVLDVSCRLENLLKRKCKQRSPLAQTIYTKGVPKSIHLFPIHQDF